MKPNGSMKESVESLGWHKNVIKVIKLLPQDSIFLVTSTSLFLSTYTDDHNEINPHEVRTIIIYYSDDETMSSLWSEISKLEWEHKKNHTGNSLLHDKVMIQVCFLYLQHKRFSLFNSLSDRITHSFDYSASHVKNTRSLYDYHHKKESHEKSNRREKEKQRNRQREIRYNDWLTKSNNDWQVIYTCFLSNFITFCVLSKTRERESHVQSLLILSVWDWLSLKQLSSRTTFRGWWWRRQWTDLWESFSLFFASREKKKALSFERILKPSVVMM